MGGYGGCACVVVVVRVIAMEGILEGFVCSVVWIDVRGFAS